MILVNHCLTISTYLFFFSAVSATPEIYTLSLHDALPISQQVDRGSGGVLGLAHHLGGREPGRGVHGRGRGPQIGGASCRERGQQTVTANATKEIERLAAEKRKGGGERQWHGVVTKSRARRTGRLG